MISDPFNLTGKVAMVTGAGRGLGYELALALANAGADVVIAELDPRSGPRAAQAVKTLGRQCLAVQTDVTNPAGVEQTVRQAIERFGRLDVLVSNAGIGHWCPAEQVSTPDWQKVIDVNLNGVFYCCQAVARHMIEKHAGSIINIASMSGQIVNIPQRQAAYNASKAAVVQLTKSLAVEWVEHGIRVNAISPGILATNMTNEYFDDPQIGPEWLRRIPMGRPGRPEELGPLAVYLAADASAYMTGANLTIDGGYTAV